MVISSSELKSSLDYFGAWADRIICFCDLTKLWLSDSKGDVLLDSYQQFGIHDASLNSMGEREREIIRGQLTVAFKKLIWQGVRTV